MEGADTYAKEYKGTLGARSRIFVEPRFCKLRVTKYADRACFGACVSDSGNFQHTSNSLNMIKSPKHSIIRSRREAADTHDDMIANKTDLAAEELSESAHQTTALTNGIATSTRRNVTTQQAH